VRPRILLADDNATLLAALRRLLNWSYTVVGTVRTGAEAIEAAGVLQPDVIVIDVRLPDINGLEVCRHVTTAALPAKVIVLTAADDPTLEQRAFAMGATGFVLKYRAGDDLIPAIERALIARAPRE